MNGAPSRCPNISKGPTLELTVRHRVTNWTAYDLALRQRGSLTVWFTEAEIAAWKAEPRATRGGQPRYSALAITTALTSATYWDREFADSPLEQAGFELAVPP
jgi:hypothetical protein